MTNVSMNKIAFDVPGKPGTFGITQDHFHLFRPHKQPMILLEEVTECNVAEKRLMGTKRVLLTDPYVQACFPDDPFLPPCFVVEALAQASGALMNLLYYADRNRPFWEYAVSDVDKLGELPHNALAEAKVTQVGLVLAGETLTVQAKLAMQRGEISMFHVSAEVGGRPIAKGEMILAYPAYIPSNIPHKTVREMETPHVAG